MLCTHCLQKKPPPLPLVGQKGPNDSSHQMTCPCSVLVPMLLPASASNQFHQLWHYQLLPILKFLPPHLMPQALYHLQTESVLV